jgi:hypothetical protein
MHPLTLRVTGLAEGTRSHCGTGFSREEAGVFDITFAVLRSTSSRLKPVPLGDRGVAAGTKTLHGVLF